MHSSPRFDELLEAVEHLTLEDRETLIEIVRRRTAEERRRELVAARADADAEFAA